MAQKITFTFPESTLGTTNNYRTIEFFTDGNLTGSIFTNFVYSPDAGSDPYLYDVSTPSYSLANTEVVKGADVNNFANNFRLFLNAQFSILAVYYKTSITDNVVELIWGNNSQVNTFGISEATSPWLMFTSEAYINPNEINTLPEQIILSRSPYHFKVSPGVTYDEITAEVFIYRGHKVDDRPAISNYQLSKSVVQVGQPTISFDIHKLANDYVKNRYNAIGIDGSFTTSTLDSVWLYVDAKVKLAGVEQYPVNQMVLAIDGFGYHTELVNPLIVGFYPKILSNISNHIIYNNSAYPLYFITEGLSGITINGEVVPFSFSQDYSNQKIGYVNIANYIGTSTSFSAVFEYDLGDNIYTHNFTIKDECKFPLINCIFKNKFGFWQTIPFNKLSKKSQDFTNESYNGLISNYGSYALNKHEKQTFNVNGKEKVTVNTDFIPEEYNLLFTELMLSEFIYLEENGELLPVNLVKNSFEKKTKLNNKLIQYSMDFEYSFNLLNDIL
jgi:hypothetical protein